MAAELIVVYLLQQRASGGSLSLLPCLNTGFSSFQLLFLSRILRRGMPVDAKNLCNGVGCLTLGGPSGDLLAKVNRKPRPPDLDAFSPGVGHARFRAVADLLRLDLCQRRKQRQQDIAHQLVVGREVQFGVGVERHAVGG